jgi:hypothetical protein
VGLGALGAGLEPVVERVAHQVQQRIFERVEHRAIDLGVFAFDLELDFLAQLARQLAHHARVFLEEDPQRQHARPLHLFRELGEISQLFVGEQLLIAVHLGGELFGLAQPGGEHLRAGP